jgi:hypothetical protein
LGRYLRCNTFDINEKLGPDVQKEMKRTETGMNENEIKFIYFLHTMVLKVHSLCKSKMYDNNSISSMWGVSGIFCCRHYILHMKQYNVTGT